MLPRKADFFRILIVTEHLLMYHRFVFNEELGDLKHTVRARTSQRLPVVFSTSETYNLMAHVTGVTGLMLKILYGGGLRVTECCRLRIKDIDFDQQLIYVRNGKGGKDRTTLLAGSVIPELRLHITKVHNLHDTDVAKGFGKVWLPNRLSNPGKRKISRDKCLGDYFKLLISKHSFYPLKGVLN